MPEVTLSLPAAIGLLALFLMIGAVMVFYALRSKPEVVIQFTPTVTVTETSTPTITATELPPTATDTPLPSPTPLSYKVEAGQSCGFIAATFGISIEAIRQANNLSVDCFISEGQNLVIPQPTPTVTPLPTSTLSVAQQTESACQRVSYEVKEGDSPSSIAVNYNVPWQSIKEENGLPGDVVYFGQTLWIPLCKRTAPPGPTSTPTPPPPYLAPNLLLPVDGSPFSLADDSVTLQWAAVGTLRENEGYMVTVEDITSGQGNKLVRFVTDTKFTVPASSRPNDRSAHIFYWWVVTVRQTGTDSDGKPVYDPAGARSA